MLHVLILSIPLLLCISTRYFTNTNLQCALTDGTCALSPVYYLCELLAVDSSAQVMLQLANGTSIIGGANSNSTEKTNAPTGVMYKERYVV
jgi:hypothetical protein